MVWDASLPGSGGYGHVGIFISWTGPNTFLSYDTNWGGKFAHNVSHNKSWVLGGLRKVAPAPVPQPQGADEMIVNADQATKLSKVLRPNGGGSQADISGWIGRPFAQWLNEAQAEVAARDTNYRAQTVQLEAQYALINDLNSTITKMQELDVADAAHDADVAQQLDEARDKVADLTAQLEASHDTLTDLQTVDYTPEPKPVEVPKESTKSSLFVRMLAAMLRKKK